MSNEQEQIIALKRKLERSAQSYRALNKERNKLYYESLEMKKQINLLQNQVIELKQNINKKPKKLWSFIMTTVFRKENGEKIKKN